MSGPYNDLQTAKLADICSSCQAISVYKVSFLAEGSPCILPEGFAARGDVPQPPLVLRSALILAGTGVT